MTRVLIWYNILINRNTEYHMLHKNTVFFISNCERTAYSVQSKVMLLREADEFVHVELKNAFEKVRFAMPKVILFDTRGGKEELLSFLNKLKQTPLLESSSVILIFDRIDEELLCTAVEAGVNDFVSLRSLDSEFTIRVLWALNTQSKSLDGEKKADILSQLNIIDKQSGIYNKNYTYTVFKEESKKGKGSLAVIAPDINTRNKLSIGQLGATVKKCIRISDTIGFSGEFKIYVWFPDTPETKILSILHKIKKELPFECSISAGITQSNNLNFDEVEEKANNALSRALLKENSFAIYSDDKKEQIKEEKKLPDNFENFRFFKENFLKKLENMISPIFFQTQTIIGEKLFETTVSHHINDDEAFFKLVNKNCESLFKITYPGYTKIKINITHNIETEVLSNSFSFNLEDIDKTKITKLLDMFVKDFQKFIS